MDKLTIETAIAYVLGRETTWEDYRHLRVLGARWDRREDLIEVVTKGEWEGLGEDRSAWGVWLQDGRIYGEC